MDDKRINEAFYIAKLISKYTHESLTEEEITFLDDWKNKSPENRQLFEERTAAAAIYAGLQELETYNTAAIAARLFRDAGIPADRLPQNRRLRVLKQARIWWAAAAILLLFTGAGYFFFKQMKPATLPMARNTTTLKPGTNKAVLLLAGGKEMVLDSTGNGLLTLQGHVQVTKSGNGQLNYAGNTVGTSDYHTLVIPRGGRYQLTLADGTTVTLNSASSIRFPAAFGGSSRTVSITGEAYFEVAANKNKPFIVEAGGAKIKVLGTHFNIMAYPDESAMKTTLVEGAVMVERNAQRVIISPGTQAILSAGAQGIAVAPANVDEVMAWTRDEFLFKSQNIKVIMRQISRWYDADIIYNDEVADIRFSGGMSRHEGILHLLELLQEDGRLKVVASGNKIIISRNKK